MIISVWLSRITSGSVSSHLAENGAESSAGWLKIFRQDYRICGGKCEILRKKLRWREMALICAVPARGGSREDAGKRSEDGVGF